METAVDRQARVARASAPHLTPIVGFTAASAQETPPASGGSSLPWGPAAAILVALGSVGALAAVARSRRGLEPALAPGAAPKPVANRPAAARPAPTKPAATKPAATRPAATKPAATRPAATKPAATKPAATKPAANKPATRKPTATNKPASGRASETPPRPRRPRKP
jgi:hypothetical protein